MVAITNIRYRDIAAIEDEERRLLKTRYDILENLVPKARGLTAAEQDEKKRIAAVLDLLDDGANGELCGRLFIATRDLFNDNQGILMGVLGNHDKGVLRGFAGQAGAGSFTQSASCQAALVLGILMIDDVGDIAPPVVVMEKAEDPRAARVEALAKERMEDAKGEIETAKKRLEELQAALTTAKETQQQEKIRADIKAAEKTLKDAQAKYDRAVAAADAAARAVPGDGGRQVVADRRDGGWAQLSRLFFAAVGEAKSYGDLAMLVLPILAQEGDPRGRGDNSPGTVDAAEFARVMRRLLDSGITADEPQLRRRVNEALNVIQNRGADGAPVSELGIDIPDFEDMAEASIVAENVRATGVFLCGAMFDELKVFEVVDKLVELYQNGLLTRTGAAGPVLYKYWKDAATRMSDGERRNFYAQTMGIPGGDGAGLVNREFNDLWLRFVSSVSSYVRQNEVERLLRAPVPAAISQQQVRKAARDIAVNLSAHAYGMVVPAALDLQGQLKGVMALLSDTDIRANYGARDMWQVVDQVATLELGGAKTSSRYRVLATCGAIITAWLANNADRISRTNSAVIDMDEVRSPPPRIDGSKATTNPTDWDLVNACELWLADTGTGDSVIDQMSQPRETPAMTSRPVQIPAIAREMLADLPGMGMSYAHTRH